MSVRSFEPSRGLRLSPTVLLRLSAVLIVALTVGHMSAYPWTSPKEHNQSRLVGSMKAVDFVFMGEHQTYWSLYFGWGVLVAALLLTIAIALWLISDFVWFAPRRVGAITGFISLLCLFGSYVSSQFFYAPPATFFAVACVVLVIATVQLLATKGEDRGGGKAPPHA